MRTCPSPTARAALCLAVVVFTACEDRAPVERLASRPPPQALEVSVDAPMRGFSWVVDGLLAAMPYPGRPEQLSAISAAGVTQLVSLTEVPVSEELLIGAGLQGKHIPIRDFTAPTLEQMDDFTAFVAEAKEKGELVGVHCGGGFGRSGTMVAAWFVSQGYMAEGAILYTRRLRPGSIETTSQEEALYEYAATFGR